VTRLRTLFGALLVLSSLPLLAAWPQLCPPSFSMTISAPDVQTGLPVTITWTSTGAPIIAQTLDISDVAYGMQLPPDQRSYTYIPAKSGTPHVRINASSGCDYVYAETKFHVQQCPIDTRDMTLSATEIDGGGSVTASVLLDKNEEVRWNIQGGRLDASSGGDAYITATAVGTMTIEASITKNGQCEAKVSRSVSVVCQEDPTIGLFFDTGAISAGGVVNAWANLSDGQTAHWEIENGSPASADGASVSVTGGTSGLVKIHLIVTKPTGCTVERTAYIFIYPY